MTMDWNIVAQIYFMTAFFCAMPWIFHWAVRKTMPVTCHLWSLLAFSATITECLWIFWEVHSEAPDRMGDARRLLFPMLFAAIVGGMLTARSLVRKMPELMKKYEEEDDE